MNVMKLIATPTLIGKIMPTYFNVMDRIYMPTILRRIKEREDEMEAKKKVRAKHVGFSGQRELCRNLGHTYIEKFAGMPVLMCNYPFPDIHHKKGVCRANTCTDMREIPQEITEADAADMTLPPLTDPVEVEETKPQLVDHRPVGEGVDYSPSVDDNV